MKRAILLFAVCFCVFQICSAEDSEKTILKESKKLNVTVNSLEKAKNDSGAIVFTLKAVASDARNIPQLMEALESHFGYPQLVSSRPASGGIEFQLSIPEKKEQAKTEKKEKPSAEEKETESEPESVSNGIRVAVGFVQKMEGIAGDPPTTAVRLVVTDGIPRHKQQGLITIIPQKAVDDTGRNLMPDKLQEKTCQPIVDYSEKFDEDHFQESFFDLKGADERAKSIRELSGQVIMHVPDQDPESMAVIENFMNRTNTTIQEGAMKNAGLSVKIWTAKQYMQVVPGDPMEMKNDKKLSEHQDPNDPKANYKDSDLVLAVTDPGHKLAGFQFLDKNGKSTTVWFRSCRSGDTPEDYYVLRPDAPLENGASMTLFMETEKSTVRVPFHLKNIRF